MWGNINITLFYVLLIMTLLIITGCSNSHNGQENIGVEVTENPDAEEVLSLDSDADIFQFDDVIYKTDVDWVEEKTLTKNKQVGETEVTTSKGIKFLEKRLPDGRGVRLELNGNFKGFID